jgi:3-hydroxyacyl-CoA dehydrogenase
MYTLCCACSLLRPNNNTRQQVTFMLEEGASPRQIDTAVRAFGMAIGESPTSVYNCYATVV